MYAVCEFGGHLESIEVQYSDYTDKKADYADDGNSLDSEYSAESLDVQFEYVYANGMLLAKYDESPADTHYYHHDGLGSVIGMTNENANVEQSYFYDDFGNSLGAWGSVNNHYLYTGQEYDGTITQLYNLRARYYDSGIGRFVSEDPIKACIRLSPQGHTLYLYTNNNSINWVDPTGTDFCFRIKSTPMEKKKLRKEHSLWIFQGLYFSHSSDYLYRHAQGNLRIPEGPMLSPAQWLCYFGRYWKQIYSARMCHTDMCIGECGMYKKKYCDLDPREVPEPLPMEMIYFPVTIGPGQIGRPIAEEVLCRKELKRRGYGD